MRISDWSSDVCSSDLQHVAQVLAHLVGLVPCLQPVARSHEELVANRHVQVRAVDVYKQVVFQQRHLERPADELGRVRAVDLTVQREKHGNVVLEVLALEVLLCLLHAMSARTRLEDRSEEHTSELQSLMRTSNAVFCLKT